MQTLYANETIEIDGIVNNLQSNQLLPSGKMEGILCPRCGSSIEPRALIKKVKFLYIFTNGSKLLNCSVQEVCPQLI